MQNQQANVHITTNEFAAKFRSKTEVYAFLSIDVSAYLPAKEAVTIYHLKDLITGKKKCKYYFRLISVYSYQIVRCPSTVRSSLQRAQH